MNDSEPDLSNDLLHGADAMRKVDLSGRAFENPRPAAKIGFFNRCLIMAGGFQPEWTMKHGAATEIWNIKLVGAACLLSFMIWTASITTDLHVILDFDRGSFNLGLILIALLIASAQALIDHITLVKSAIYAKGEHLLRTAGIKLPSAKAASKAYRVVNTARPMQACAFAAISVTFALLAAEGPGIRDNLWSNFQNSNSTNFAQAAHAEDDKKARDVAVLATKTGEVNSLTRSAVPRPGSARKAPRGSSPATDAANERVQKQLAAAETKRDALRLTVERDDAERNANIEKMVASSPQAVPRRTDLAAQLGALWHLIAENPLMWVVAGLLMVVGCSLELGFMWVAAGYPSAPLCARLVLEDYTQLTEIRKEGQGRLDIRPDEHTPEPPDDRPPPIGGGTSAAAKPPEFLSKEPLSPPAPNIVPDRAPDHPPEPSVAIAMNGATPAARRGRGRPKGSGKSAGITEKGNA